MTRSGYLTNGTNWYYSISEDENNNGIEEFDRNDIYYLEVYNPDDELIAYFDDGWRVVPDENNQELVEEIIKSAGRYNLF